MTDNAPGWQPDPTGRHDHRYWDGSAWTDNVADAGVASTDAYAADEPVDAAPDTAPEAEAPLWAEPTTILPAASGDPTATWPTTPAPPPPPSYTPPPPGTGGPLGPDGSGGSKRGLLIGGGILAAVAVAVIAFLLLGGDDDDGAAVGTYGSDPELDELHDQCGDGDYQACDDLYNKSPSGSGYEEFADTCGDRNEPAGYCMDIYEDGDDDGGSGIDGDLPAGFEKQLADIYEDSLGLSQQQAECLAGKLAEAVSSGDLSESEAFSEIFEFLSDCDIDPSEISGG